MIQIDLSGIGDAVLQQRRHHLIKNGRGQWTGTGDRPKPTTHMSQSFAVPAAGSQPQATHQPLDSGHMGKEPGMGRWPGTSYRLYFRRRRGPEGPLPADAESEKTGPKVGRKSPRVNSLEEAGFLPGKRDLNDSAQGLERTLHPEWDSGSA